MSNFRNGQVEPVATNSGKQCKLKNKIHTRRYSLIKEKSMTKQIKQNARKRAI